ncbi:efflux RND transporter periplasmic adaptor subunit [Heliophilum fasciatum]|uniref:RND family efflux transporter MFP subunit n=1 Tax=Heliophilum fasciatum TaxID=35700 RepID=A0A4R2RY77_9FIRM|nr:efflux RND transporter periplasmic adaptor subunit [Heliophilum fasciatum]MCW2278984.1 multidrug efflux pump subunit AcrA (membrane-fusion protein) [Heliophilum fasciatum]TCP64065.1 RND family efflux transporter MFP subunit [Heliophilum fasciatum]
MNRLPLIKKSALIILPLGALLLWLSGALHSKVEPGIGAAKADQLPAATVRTLAVQPANQAASLRFDGVVKGSETIQLTSKLLAQVQAVSVREGDRVSQGDSLISLDNRDISANRSAASSQIDSAVATQANAQAALASAQAQLNNAQITWTRTQALFNSGAVTAADRDRDKTALDSALAQVEQAKAVVQQAQAAIQSATAGVTQLDVQLGYTQLTAPFNAVVSKKHIDTGTMAAPGAPLLTLEKTPLALHIQVDERLAPRLQKGQSVDVTIESIAKNLTGTILDVQPTVDPASRTALVKIALPGDKPVQPGMFGIVTFSGENTSKLTIPASAVVKWSQFTGVYVIDNQAEPRARLRLLRLGEPVGDRYDVIAGLQPGEQIITEGQATLTDGQKVVVQE